MNEGTRANAISIIDTMQFTTLPAFFFLPVALFRLMSHMIPAKRKRTARIPIAKKNRHFRFVAGTRMIPSISAASAVLMTARFLSHAAFSPNLVNVSTTSAISASAKIIRKISPIINQPFVFVMATV